MIEDRGMNSGEFPLTSHMSEALHGPFSSSKRKVKFSVDNHEPLV